MGTINKRQDHAPCLHCEDREPGCHGKCERYAKWLEPILKARAERQKNIEANSYEIMRYVTERDKKRRRTHGQG